MGIAAMLVVAANVEVLTLAEAVKTAETHQPQIAQARANVEAAQARIGEARSAILPQLTGSAVYQRTTANFVARPGIVPSQLNMVQMAPTFTTFNFYTFTLTLSQYLWDFRAPFALGATKASAEAQSAGAQSTRNQVLLNVRTAFFNARAQAALAHVAHDNLANQKRHLDQIRGFVAEGVRPEIDLAQAETDYANAQVQDVNTDNAYQVAKVQLNQAMGVERNVAYEVSDDSLPPIAGEEEPIDSLFLEATKTRPDLLAFERQIRAQQLTVTAIKGGYGPTFTATMTVNDIGTGLGNLIWNWNTTVTANWPLFDGLLTWSQVKEASATLRSIEAQREALRQQIMVDVSQARLQVQASRVAFNAADKAVTSAQLQLTLAEGRYREGVGNVIELGDAQIAFVTAAAQRVQADYNLATARAQLLRALGRP